MHLANFPTIHIRFLIQDLYVDLLYSTDNLRAICNRQLLAMYGS